MDLEAPVKPQTAYDMVGGSPIVRQIVDRFYDLLDAEPDYGELRALHAADLDPMRSSLTGFLSAWLGGPNDWFRERTGVCMMSAHRDVAITPASAQQWANAMTRAIDETVADKAIASKMGQALGNMAIGMSGMGR